MLEVPPTLFLVLSGMLFVVGAIGVITRRNGIILFMCIELMLNAVNLAFVSSTKITQSLDGMVFVFFVMAVAATEAAVGLAIFVMIFRLRGTVNVDEISLLRG